MAFNAPVFRRAARFGDAIIGGDGMDVRWHGYNEALHDAGSDPASARLFRGLLRFLVSEDPERSWHEVAPHVLHQVNTYLEEPYARLIRLPKSDSAIPSRRSVAVRKHRIGALQNAGAALAATRNTLVSMLRTNRLRVHGARSESKLANALDVQSYPVRPPAR